MNDLADRLQFLFWFFFGVFTDDDVAWRRRRKFINDRGRPFRLWIDAMQGAFHALFLAAAAALLCLCRMAGFGMGRADKDAKPVIRETATLFSIVLTAGGFLIVGQIDANRPIYQFITAFGIVAAAMIAGMVVILMARNPETNAHAYDWASIRFTQFAVIAAIGISFGLVWLAYAGQLPFQSFVVDKKADLGEASKYTFKADKTEGVIVPVKLNQELYRKGMPPKLLMSITLRETIAENWRIEDVDGDIGSPSESTPMNPPPVEYPQKDGPPNKTIWYLNGLRDGKSYTIRIFLHQKGKLQPDVGTLLANIRDKGVVVTFHSKEK